MSLIVVTGSTGHVGATLVRALLDRGQHVRALIHRDTRAVAGLDVETVTGDIQDHESLCRAFGGADIVYHAAAHISISMRGWEQIEATNVAGTRNVVRACLECGVGRLVHFSSIEALESKPLSTPVDEDRPLISSPEYPPYARSKAAGEGVVREAVASGLNAVILYPTAIIGPGDYRLGFSSAGLLGLYRGRLLALTNGGFNWVDVRDVVEGALRAADRAPAGGRYILGGHWASLHDLAVLIHDVNGARVPRVVVPLWAARLGAPILTAWSHVTGQRPLYTTAALKPLSGNRRTSYERAARDLDYRPRPLRDTVADMWQWFQSAGLVPRNRA